MPAAESARVGALLAISRDVVLVVRHADHAILGASPVAERVYGLTVEVLRTMRYDDLVTDRSAVDEIFARHREHVPLRYHRRADGSRFPVEMTIHWLEGDGAGHGDSDGEQGYFRICDLTGVELEERRLQAAKDSYQAIFHAAPFPILLLDRRGMVAAANDAALALYRGSEATLVGRPVARLLQDERMARRYFRSARWQVSGQWHRRCDGELFLADVFVSIVRLPGEAQAVMVVRDVTEERALLDRVQASEARWRFALEGHGDALWEWDLARGSFHVSRQLSEQIGTFPPAPPDAGTTYWSALVHPGDRGRLDRDLLAHIKGETALVDTEVRLRLRGDTDRWFWLRGRVMERNESGRALRLLGSVRDVQQQKQQAEELAHWREQVQHTARVTSMGEMAAALAHELNQPLTSIRNFSAAALRRLDHEGLRDLAELRRAVQLIADEAMRAGRIMQHIHNFIRKGQLRTEAVSINELITGFQRLADIQARRAEAVIDLDLTVGLPLVQVDRVLVEQLLLNLVRNGLDAMPPAPHRTSDRPRRIEISTAVDAAGQVQVSVRDSGIGLPAHLVADLYTPFVSTKPDGLGMGLAICRSIVESHHGRLWAEANPAGGAVFHFTLPVAVPTAAPQETAHAPTLALPVAPAPAKAPRVRRR
ncbi:PAS domain S-box protein [Sphaerotilus montanus]|uniref:histidine kinase n=1 Tax=Sphaerotilus montanus TaxID=522889 RepID=A0A7Y9QWN4_9BURK|nr:PAS domain S-box protein [Sphaerotilus montanus]NYG32826.1 PAS domain S-box-containing protein [Sphaerotilus montanus]NZD56784.1 PAS domain S-box protein [Sphaerotilus montanus]